MVNIIVSIIIIVAVGAAVHFIWKEKKRGRKCIGCPYSGDPSCNCHSKQ